MPNGSIIDQILGSTQPTSLGAGGSWNVAGGSDIASMALQAYQLAQAMELGRRGIGQNLLDKLFELQQNPFSIVPALQSYGAAGGGPLAPAAALAQSGGVGMQSPYGPLIDRLLAGMSEFAGGAPINPNTGAPYLPNEMDYLRMLTMRQPASTTTTTPVSEVAGTAKQKKLKVTPTVSPKMVNRTNPILQSLGIA